MTQRRSRLSTHVIVDSLREAGYCGDFERYEIVLLCSRPITAAELSEVLAGFQRPLPSASRERQFDID